MGCAIGIDIGGTRIRAARVSSSGALLSHLETPCPRDPEAVRDTCLRMVAELQMPEATAIGIGIPSRVIAEERRILPGGYVDLSDIGFAEAIEQASSLPVTLENDATMALIAEMACGAAQGCNSAVILTIGTGIGGAIVDRGRIVRGGALAGQLGHIPVEAPGRPCLCGRSGCVETTSSGTAFARHLEEAGLPAGTRIETLLARQDDAARRVITAWAAPLQRAIEALAAVLAPDCIVLGGGAGASAAAAIGRLPARSSWYDTPIRPAALGDRAGVIGAALAARPRAAPKRAVLVNGVPASGKSTVARALSEATGWPVLALDTVKNPFLQALPPGDRAFNRVLGRAAYAAIFDLIRDAPAGATVIVDAWFGFQPVGVLQEGLRRAGVTESVELWCNLDPETTGRRYAARVDSRPAGHPGLDYVPELVALAARAEPTGIGPVLRVDTQSAPAPKALADWIAAQWKGPRGWAEG